jgi:hypothetical protein
MAVSLAGCSGLANSGGSGNGNHPVAPSIITQPANQSVIAGQPATFSVAASGSAPLSYQWRKNTINISGATADSYTTPATTTADNTAKIDVIVTNSVGSVTSVQATLTVNAAPVAPSISTQPLNQTVTSGQTATFSVVATGTAPLSYQWRKNSVNIRGATGASYATPATTIADNNAKFDVVVTNSVSSVTSAQATLTVNAAPVAPTITTQPANQTVTAGPDRHLQRRCDRHRAALLPMAEEFCKHRQRDGGELHDSCERRGGQQCQVRCPCHKQREQRNERAGDADCERCACRSHDHHAAGESDRYRWADGHL